MPPVGTVRPSPDHGHRTSASMQASERHPGCTPGAAMNTPEAVATNLKECTMKLPSPTDRKSGKHDLRLRYLREVRGLFATLAVLIGAITGLVIALAK